MASDEKTISTETRARMYYDDDADLGLLDGKTVAIIGCGSQGHAHALNLQESGVTVVVGELPGPIWDKAKEAGLNVMETTDAAKQGDIIVMLVPDTVQPKVYESQIAPHIESGNALVFAHGFNIHFDTIQAPDDVDVFMVAPKGPGHIVRATYARGGGVPALFAIHQDPSGTAKDTAGNIHPQASARGRPVDPSRASVSEQIHSQTSSARSAHDQATRRQCEPFP